MSESDDKNKKVTFFSKKAIVCPVCDTSFYKEEMFTGGGRLVAGILTEELRRLYEPSKKFGELFPLIYYMLVCPNCFYSAFPTEFEELDLKMAKPKLNNDTLNRKNNISMLFPDLNFTEPRTMQEGTASFILAVMCYEHMDKKASPTIKQGLCCLRSAWMLSELHRKSPGENWDYLSKLFYSKASFFYTQAVEKEQNGLESLGGLKNMGPDLDKNYGYDGVLYLAGYLEYNFGPKNDVRRRIEQLEKIKRIVAKMHGIGKASKDKPSAILNKAKDLYDLIGKEIQDLSTELE